MSYFLAPALVELRDETNKLFPNRDTSSDGWIGDPSHAARISDHNPDWNASGKFYGIVRALDLDITDNSPKDLRKMLLEATIGDPRVWYVISNQIIYSRTYGWEARRYTGANGHFEHVHVSLRHFAGEFDTARWFDSPVKFKPRKVNLDAVQAAFRDALNDKSSAFNLSVRRTQKALNHRYGFALATDGIVGPGTLSAWATHETRTSGKGRKQVPDEKSLRALVGSDYMIVPR